MKDAKNIRICPSYIRNEDESWKKDSYIGIDYTNARDANTTTQTYIEYAATVAKKSTMVQKHGCVIVHKKKVIAVGFNFSVIPCRLSIHAEHDAINKAKKQLSKADLKNCQLYVVRIGQDSMENPLKYSKPCPTCEMNINNIGLNPKKVFYSTNFQRDMCVPIPHNAKCFKQ